MQPGWVGELTNPCANTAGFYEAFLQLLNCAEAAEMLAFFRKGIFFFYYFILLLKDEKC